MRILFFQWNAFMQKEIEEELKKSDIQYKTYYYIFKDWDKDDKFMQSFEDELKKDKYDAVFSVNFSPLISEVCKNNDIKYISWIYDCPLHIRNLKPLGNSCNEVYFFDRSQVDKYKKEYPSGNFHHLPLAVRAKYIEVSEDSYNCDVSLVGKLYKSDFNYLCSPLDNYYRGYLEGIVQTQIQISGGYIISDMVNDGLIKELNRFYMKDKKSGAFAVVKLEELEYALATEATGRQRMMALLLLQSRMKTALYSNEQDERLDRVDYRGYIDYYTQMPQAFSKSRINLNISLTAIQSGIPLRGLDILGTGSFALTNLQPELLEYFVPDESIVIYQSMEELVEKAQFYACNDEIRRKIAKNGHEIIKDKFNFTDRVSELLEI